MSKDVYGHLTTVTGALWTPRGRTFDGVDDRIYTEASVPFNTENIYTALAWLNPTTSGDPKTFLSFGANSPSGGYLDEFSLRNLYARCCNYADGWTGSGGLVSINTWAHLALIHDGANDNVKIYVNGVLGLDASYSSDLLTTTGVVTLGCLNTVTPGEFFAGTIGEVSVYKRALTSFEIQQNYLKTKWRYV